LEQLDQKVDPPPEILVVLDNGFARLEGDDGLIRRPPRYVLQYTPKHASWLNQVECLFSMIARKPRRRGQSSSREDLVEEMMAFIAHHRDAVKPFKWVYDAKAAA
jgi:hypothetical protein